MPDEESTFRRQVARKAARKLESRRTGDARAWFGLGMFGMVGWSVALPTVFGALLGAWLDRHHPNGHSWTLSLLVAGLLLGCVSAWHWVSRESATMTQPPRDDHE